jgi:hypothetical protein
MLFPASLFGPVDFAAFSRFLTLMFVADSVFAMAIFSPLFLIPIWLDRSRELRLRYARFKVGQ